MHISQGTFLLFALVRREGVSVELKTRFKVEKREGAEPLIYYVQSSTSYMSEGTYMPGGRTNVACGQGFPRRIRRGKTSTSWANQCYDTIGVPFWPFFVAVARSDSRGLERGCYFIFATAIRNAMVSHAAPSVSCKVVSSARYRFTRATSHCLRPGRENWGYPRAVSLVGAKVKGTDEQTKQ